MLVVEKQSKSQWPPGMSGVWYCANQGWSLHATVLIVDSYLVYPRVIRKRQTWLREWQSPRQNRLSRPPFLWCSAIPVSALGTRQFELKDWVLNAKEPGTSQPFLVLLSGGGVESAHTFMRFPHETGVGFWWSVFSNLSPVTFLSW